MSVSRREFIVSVPGTAAILSPASRILAGAARRDTGRNTALVVVQLSGGNDGLNTLVPYADDAYGRARRTLRLGRGDVHRVDDYCGFHPAMKGFARLLKEGTLSIVRGVGYPAADRSHPGAMRNWHTARPGEKDCRTGWVGRAADVACRADRSRAPAVFVGNIAPPQAVVARRCVVPAVRAARDLVFRRAPAGGPPGHAAPPGDGNPLADHVRRTTRAAFEMSAKIGRVINTGGGGTYPSSGLAADLETVADLVCADVGIRVFFTELGGGGIGGFDNHAAQRDNHAALLEQLSAAVAAFVDDLGRRKCLDRVILMTFSEFGRTLTENGRKGTGHGAAAPVFLAGGKLRGGLVGDPPRLDDLAGDAPQHRIDYRRVYASVLEGWLGLDAAAVLGERYEPLDLFEA